MSGSRRGDGASSPLWKKKIPYWLCETLRDNPSENKRFLCINESEKGKKKEEQNMYSDFTYVTYIRIYHECEGRIEISVPRIAVWHHEACRVMTNGDPEGRIFLSYPQTNFFFFSCSPLFFSFKISFQKSLNTLRCIFTWWRHFNIAMTSLDDNVREFQYNQWIKPSRESLG